MLHMKVEMVIKLDELKSRWLYGSNAGSAYRIKGVAVTVNTNPACQRSTEARANVLPRDGIPRSAE